MAIKNFIPTVWNAALLTEFRQLAIAATLCNRSYEGDAVKGNSVKITTALPIAVKDYATGVVSDGSNGTKPRTTAPDDVTTTQISLNIDQEKSFDFKIDDIDRHQAAGDLSEFARSAAYGLVEDADKWILAQIVAGAATGNKLTGALADNGEAVWNVIRDLRKALAKTNTPNDSRVLIVNAEFEARLLGFHSKLTAVDMSGSPAGLREAFLGRVLGFDVYTSENLPVTNKAMAVAFHKSAFGFVSQITNIEAMRDIDSFADRLRGLNVYGGVAVRPTAIATFMATS